MKMKEYTSILLFLIFIGGISLFNVTTKDNRFSEFENRPLAQFPTFTIERLLSGDFNRDFEKYMSDQFFAKEWWTGLKVKAEQTVLKQENHGIYFAKDDYLIEKSEPLTSQLDKNIVSLNHFKEKNPEVNFYLTLAPTSIDLYPEKLPLFANEGIHQQAMDRIKSQLHPSVQIIDVYTPLQKRKQADIYYRTDHHWTTTGAFYAYQEVVKEMGMKPFQEDDFFIETVAEDFYGSFYTKANDYRISPDTIEIFKPKRSMEYSVTFEDGTRLDGLYDESYLRKRDQYAYFLGGNHAKAIVKSSVNNGKKLLLIKDSYAHAIAPFLANHFEEIHMIDLRYYHESLQAYMKEHAINDVLMLYNTPNFSIDTSIIYVRY